MRGLIPGQGQFVVTLVDVKLLRRREADTDQAADLVVESDIQLGKGRPTPKRRDTTPKRGPVNAPRTQKEANERIRQQSKSTRGSTKLSREAHREALRRGDDDVLPRRDKGPVRRLARDWVDSHFMLSNWLLILFPLMIIGYSIPVFQIVVLAAFLLVIVEWFVVGRRIHALAVSRLGIDKVRDRPLGLGFYAGTRAYMPRRWRMPAPHVSRGDAI